MPRKKKPRGRPVIHTAPEPIPDKPENIVRTVLKTRPKAERDLLKAKAAKPS